MRSQVQPAPRHRHVGAEPVVARLRVVERQPLDGRLDHPHAPALFPAGDRQLVEESVVGLDVGRPVRHRGPRADRPSRAKGPPLPAGPGIDRVHLAVRPAREDDAPREGRPCPERRASLERPHRLGRRPPGLPPVGSRDPRHPAEHQRDAVDRREHLRHHPGERAPRGVVDERERPQLQLAALELRRDRGHRLALEVHRRDRRLQGQLALGRRLELQGEQGALPVVRDRPRPRPRQVGGQRGGRGALRGRTRRGERHGDDESAGERVHGPGSGARGHFKRVRTRAFRGSGGPGRATGRSRS